MPTPTTDRHLKANKAFNEIIEALPKGKRLSFFPHAQEVLGYINDLGAALDMLRRYLLDTEAGDDSPFVQKTDELVPRPPGA